MFVKCYGLFFSQRSCKKYEYKISLIFRSKATVLLKKSFYLHFSQIATPWSNKELYLRFLFVMVLWGLKQSKQISWKRFATLVKFYWVSWSSFHTTKKRLGLSGIEIKPFTVRLSFQKLRFLEVRLQTFQESHWSNTTSFQNFAVGTIEEIKFLAIVFKSF